MHDQLYFNHGWAQTGRTATGLFRDFARAAGVDLARYDACMESGRYASRIEFSRQEGSNGCERHADVLHQRRDVQRTQ